jgi:hypothetical protein
MPVKTRNQCILITIATLLVFQCTFAQEAVEPRKSPLEVVTLKYEATYVKVTYSRPHKNGRRIFGDLVPYGEIWRTGANEATEITFTQDVSINGKRVPAGTYTLFTIPGADQWRIILNSDLGLWGSYNYNPDKNILSVTAPVTPLQVTYEPFTMEFRLQNGEADLLMMWDKTQVSLTIKFID